MMYKNIFKNQLPSGQIPTLMINKNEGKQKFVDTLAITMVATYLAQLNKNWHKLWDDNIQQALNFIQWRLYQHEIECFPVWHFNGFYPADWEDTSFAIYLLVKNKRINIKQLEKLRELLIFNTTEFGTGVWVKDLYSNDNYKNNHWDPTTSLNILRLHYLLDVDIKIQRQTEQFIVKNLTLKNFSKSTLYYTPAISAFFAEQLVMDFPEQTIKISSQLLSFKKNVLQMINKATILATPFERALLGLSSKPNDNGLIFHHGKRTVIWYGSPVLHQLAQTTH